MTDQPVQIGTPESGMAITVPTTDLDAAIEQKGVDEKRQMRRSLLWVFLIFLCIHLFVFRGILVKIPDIFAGKAVVNTHELVPFFDVSEQFIEQAGGAFSDLTNAYEFRVRYSLLTTWMRYYLILPFAIILVPFLGAFFVFLVVNDFLRRLLPSIPARRIIHATALTTLLIHFILLPAKIPHFYTLILGFDIFVVSFVLFLHGLLLESRHPVQLLFVSSLVALVNPAVHFLVLYPLSVVFFCAGTGILLLISGGIHKGTELHDTEEKRTASLRLWKRIFLALLFMTLVTVVPYGLFVKFYVLRGLENLTDVVPDTVASIRASSLTLVHQISFDISSATGNYLGGSYITKTPQYSKIFYFLIALIPFVIPVTRDVQEKRRLRPFLTLTAILMLFGMWCSVGYADIVLFPTFHMLLAALFRQLYLLPEHAAEIGIQVITEVIHVLRFPDRFQFIFLAAMTLLMPLGTIVLERDCAARIAPQFRLGRFMGTTLCAIVFFFPLFAHWEYSASLFTGDFGGFLRPYNVESLREIKNALQPLPQGKTVVFPPSESPWIGKTSDGHRYRFIDKFFIYYLNSPSYYFGLSGDPETKYWFYLLSQSLTQNEHWWINIFRNLNIRYLVINKEMVVPLRSSWYLQSITQSIRAQPQAMPQFFRKIRENDSFTLYEFIDLPQAAATPLLIELGWNSFRCLQERSLTLSRSHQLVSLNSLQLKQDVPLDVVAGDWKKMQLDLFAKEHADHFFRPDQSSFAFIEEHIPSSQYFGTVFPMLNLLTASNYNIFRIMMPGPYDTLTTSFVGLIDPTSTRFSLTVPKNGTYEVLLRSVPTQHQLSMQIDHGPVTSITYTPENSDLHYITSGSASHGTHASADTGGIAPEDLASKIPSAIMPTGDQFTYIQLGIADLLEGRHILFLKKQDNNPLVIEGVLLLPIQKQVGDIPLQTTIHALSPDLLNE